MQYSAEDVFAYFALADSQCIVNARKVILMMVLLQYKRLILGQIVKLVCEFSPLSKTEFIVHAREIKPLDPFIPFRASEKYGFRLVEGDYGVYLLKPKRRERALAMIKKTLPRPVLVRAEQIADIFSAKTLTETEARTLNILGLTYADLWRCGGMDLDECISAVQGIIIQDVCK